MIFHINIWTLNPILYYNACVFDANTYQFIQDSSMHWDNLKDVTVVIQNKIVMKFGPMEFVLRIVKLHNFAKLFLKFLFYIIYCVMMIWNNVTARSSIKYIRNRIPNPLFFVFGYYRLLYSNMSSNFKEKRAFW